MKNAFIKSIVMFVKQFKVISALKKANCYKEKGIGVQDIFCYLLQLIYTGKSVNFDQTLFKISLFYFKYKSTFVDIGLIKLYYKPTNREFKDREKLEVVVSDLTYVRVNKKWSYICTLLDLYNREIIGFSAGPKKDANLVYQAFLNCKYPLTDIKIFHTDRGNEFKNKTIDEVINIFEKERDFDNIDILRLELGDYINWYNNHRLHGSLNYLTPMEYNEKMRLEVQ